jgi:hypothetical protein
LGSGKFDTPFLRIQAAKRASAVACSACWAGVSWGGPPPGRNFRHACSAAWNCDELGSTFPIDTPKIVLPPLGGPEEAGNPREATHAAKAALLGLVDGEDWLVLVVVEVVGARLATEGAFELPPQPAASSARPAVAKKASVRPISHER